MEEKCASRICFLVLFCFFVIVRLKNLFFSCSCSLLHLFILSRLLLLWWRTLLHRNITIIICPPFSLLTRRTFLLAPFFFSSFGRWKRIYFNLPTADFQHFTHINIGVVDDEIGCWFFGEGSDFEFFSAGDLWGRGREGRTKKKH